MATAYTSLLGLALPQTGELSGTWGATVNSNITEYLDAAVAGAQVISGSQTAVTLSKTTGSALSQAAAGATGSSQYQIIRCTGNPGAGTPGLLTITVPSADKTYIVINATSNSQSVKIVGAGGGTGVTVSSGTMNVVAWNGTDFTALSSGVSLSGNNTWTGTQTFTAYTETVYALSGTDINPANGTVQTKTLGANTTFTESIASGQSVILMLNPSTYTTTWPTMTWINIAGSGSAPTLKASATNVVVMWQVGSTVYGSWLGSN